VLLPSSPGRRTIRHRQDACATSGTGGTPEEGHRQDACATSLFAGTANNKTQAGCLCYCGDGRDAQDTGRMPVLLRGRAGRPRHRQDACATAGTGGTPKTQAGCLCYCGDGRDAQDTGRMPVLLPSSPGRRTIRHRQDACATSLFAGTANNKTQAGCLCYCGDGRDAQDTGRMPVLLPSSPGRRTIRHRQDACATSLFAGTANNKTQAGCLCYFPLRRDGEQ
jgi:hypothetical protein